MQNKSKITKVWKGWWIVVDVVVIGKGIIGSTVARALKNQGMKVKILDADKPMAGTPPSGGHCKPEWFKGMSKDDYTPALELLHEVWDVSSEKFSLLGMSGKWSTVYRVDTDEVIKQPYTKGTVTKIYQTSQGYEVRYRDKLGDYGIQCRYVVAAVGVFTEDLFPDLKVQEKRGISFRFNRVLKKPFIKPWAPYKQIVAHQQTEDTVWIGDGSAILKANWTPERSIECEKRCRKALGLLPGNKPLEIRTGLRAYCELPQKKNPCLFLEVKKGLFLATGAGKSGTIGAGWVASRLIQKLT